MRIVFKYRVMVSPCLKYEKVKFNLKQNSKCFHLQNGNLGKDVIFIARITVNSLHILLCDLGMHFIVGLYSDIKSMVCMHLIPYMFISLHVSNNFGFSPTNFTFMNPKH